VINSAFRSLAPVLPHFTKIVATKGEGVFLFDARGRRYLDFTSGIGRTILRRGPSRNPPGHHHRREGDSVGPPAERDHRAGRPHGEVDARIAR
jgi:hypothetical protein